MFDEISGLHSKQMSVIQICPLQHLANKFEPISLFKKIFDFLWHSAALVWLGEIGAYA